MYDIEEKIIEKRKMKKFLYETTVEEFLSSIDKFKNKYVRVIKLFKSNSTCNPGWEKGLDTGVVQLISKENVMRNGGLDTVFYDSSNITGKSAIFAEDMESADGTVFWRKINLPAYRVFCNEPIHDYMKKAIKDLGLQIDGYYRSCIPSRNYTDVKGFGKKQVDCTLIEILVKEEVVRVYEIGQREVYDTDELFKLLKEAFDEYKQKELVQKIKDNMSEASSTATVTAIEYDGETDLRLSMLRALGYRHLIYSKEIGWGKDHRFNRGHHKLGYFLHEDVLQNKSIKAIEMKLPKSSFGKFIGKGGSNIKKIERLIGKKIKLIESN